MTDYQSLLALLQQHNTFVLTTHVNPDADAIGSTLAMHRLLVKMGKKVRLINHSDTPHFLRFLDTDGVIEKYDPALHDEAVINANVVIMLDFNRADRMARMAALLPEIKGIKICIDHHQDPENIFDYVFSDTEWCATGHFMYRFITEINLFPLTYEFAEPLYAALMTDTGSFRFERTTPEVHRITAHLLEAGVVPNYLHQQLYDQNTPGKMQLLGQALSQVKLLGEDEEIGVMILRHEQFKSTGTREDDTEGFINLMMSIVTIKMGLKFIELPEGFKVSLRSKGVIPMHKFAEQFGGGGHVNAAGIRIRNAKFADKYEEIIDAAVKFLKENNHE